MIAKLIVRGETREIAIQKLHAALADYEIAGPATNVDFLGRVCQCPAFVAADLETGFITKWKDQLFAESNITPEIYAQAALGAYHLDAAVSNSSVLHTGFLQSIQCRDFAFIARSLTGTTNSDKTVVNVKSVQGGLFDVQIGSTKYASVASHWDSRTKIVTSYFPHTRLETRLISDEGNITLFQQGQQHRLQFATPNWVDKALGLKDNAHSVLAPMPCKILRVQIEKGQSVTKDQPLVVIESMKMETVIRSPQDGIVSKVVHKQGVSVQLSSKVSLLIWRRIFAKQALLWLNLNRQSSHGAGSMMTLIAGAYVSR